MILFQFDGTVKAGWPLVCDAKSGRVGVTLGESGRGRLLARVNVLPGTREDAEWAARLADPAPVWDGPAAFMDDHKPDCASVPKVHRADCTFCPGRPWLPGTSCYCTPSGAGSYEACTCGLYDYLKVLHAWRDRRDETLRGPKTADLERRGNGFFLVPGANTNPSRAAVIIRDRSGFRGSWDLTNVPPVCATGPAVRHDKDSWDAASVPACPACGRSLKTETSLDRGHFVERPVCLYPGRDAPGSPKVLVEGRKAQGAAGRAGGGPEYLVIMEPGQRARIARSGRLYGNPPEEILEWDGLVLTSCPIQQYRERNYETAAADETF